MVVEVQHAVATEGDARGAGLRQNENILHIGERAAIPAAACDSGGSFAAIQRLGVGEIHEMILGKTRMERDVHVAVDGARIARFAGPIGGRSAGDGLRIENAVADDAQAAGALGDQHVAIGKKRQAPGIFERLGDHDDADVLAFGGVENHGVIGQRTRCEAGGRNRNVVFAIPLDF